MTPLAKRLSWAAAIALACSAAAVYFGTKSPGLYSSPTASRAHLSFLRNVPSWNDAQKPEASFRWLSVNTGLTIHEQSAASLSLKKVRRPKADRETEPVTKLHSVQAGENAEALLDEGRLKLLAIAVHWQNPLAEMVRPQFYDPVSLAPLSASQLTQMGVPDDMLEMKTQAGMPVFRLLFEWDGQVEFNALSLSLYDGRTFAGMGASFSSEAPFLNMEGSHGRFGWVDGVIFLWHDTPLIILLDLPRGTPDRRPLALQGGQSFQFQPESGRPIHIDLLAGGLGKLSLSRTPEARGVADVDVFSIEPSPAPYLVWNSPNSTEGDSTELRVLLTSGGERRFNLRERLFLPMPAAEIERMELNHYPGRQRVRFDISRLPMVPNRRDEIHNLFDVRIPEEMTSISGYWLAGSCQLKHDGDPSDAEISSRADCTLGELTRLFAKKEDYEISVDADTLTMKFDELHPAWWAGIAEWWDEHRPW